MTVCIDTNLKTKGKIAVVYARYSSHSQTEQSIEGQLSAARTYAAARGYTIIHEYIDRAQTGRNDNRDEFQQMLSDTSKRQFDVIIVWKVDRFGRNREEITFNKYHCKKNGVRVEYVAENLPDSPEAVILESVLEGMAEYYSLQLSQNIKRGYRENAKKGKFCGGKIPLGYKLDADKRFIIDPDTAPIVKLIFQWYAEGQTVTEITTRLNQQGVKTGTKSEWTKNSLRRMLKNEKYIGNIVFKDGEIRVDGVVPPLIDPSTFERVQRMLEVNHRAPAARWSNADYLLTGKLFCGSCGALMVGESGTSKTGAKHNYYLCINHKRTRTCKQKAIRQDLIEPFVVNQIRELLKDTELLDFLADKTWDYYQAQDETREKIRLLNKQLEDVDKSIANLMRAIEAGLFNTATKNRMDELDSQKAALEAAIAGMQLESDLHITKDHIRYYLFKLSQDTCSDDPEVVHRLIDTFVNAVFIYPDKITMTFNFCEEDKNTIILEDIERGNDDPGFGCRALCSTKARAYELFIFGSVFALTVKNPARI